MSADLTLPGDIPGLLRRGSPVLYRDEESWWTVLYIEDDEACAAPVGEVPLGAWGHLSDFALDLSDPTGRAHAAWWLAEQVSGHPAQALWDGTPDGSGGSRFCVWRLRWRSQTWPHAPCGVGAEVYSVRDVPALVGLDPDDPRLMPTGSRWVDAEALRRVVLHVAGREVPDVG